MQTFNRKRLILAITGLFLAIAINAYNGWLNKLPNGLHETADDASYLAPAKNFVQDGTWKDNTSGASSYVQRSPGMGALHAAGFLIFGNYGPVAVMYLAFLLHALSIFALSGIFRKFLSEKQSVLLTLIYVLLPCFWGFLSYQITESVSSSLIILTVYSSFSQRKFSPAFTIFLLTFCWFLRPVLVLLLIPVIYHLVQKRSWLFNRKLLFNGISLVLCVTAVFLWEKRKVDYTGNWFDLHPIYHETNQTMFRPVHKDLSNLFRAWETKPEDFHTLMGYCWNAKRTQNDPVIRSYYRTHTIPISIESFEKVLLSYSAAENEIQQHFGPEKIFESKKEQETSALIKAEIQQVKTAGVLYNYKTPFKSAREMLSKSQLNLEIFQDQMRGNILIELIRYLSLATIILSLIFSFGAFFTRNTSLILMAAGILSYLFYLFYIQRMCEDRYLIPALPIMLICSGISVLMLCNKTKV